MLKVKLLHPNAKVPTRGSEEAAGLDLYACIDYDHTIQPDDTLTIPTGIAIAVKTGYAGFIFARSGLATKQGLRPANCVGVIDSDYRGEVLVVIHNDSKVPQTITKDQRIAQLIITAVRQPVIEVCEDLPATLRDTGGFGSTGL